MKKKILAVGPEDGVLRKLDRVLWRSSFEVHRLPEASGVEALCRDLQPQLVVAGVPLPDMEVEGFLSSIRQAIPPSRVPAIVLIADQDHLVKLGDLSDPRLVVLEGTMEDERLQAEVLRLIDSAARVARRLLLRLQVHLGQGTVIRMLQTENVSDTGMLVRSSEFFPLGTEIDFEFTVPDDDVPIKGRAEVVRPTVPETEKVQGLGIRFMAIERDGHHRLRTFLAYRRGL